MHVRQFKILGTQANFPRKKQLAGAPASLERAPLGDMGAERTTSSGSNAAEDEVGPNPTFDALRKVAIVVSYYVAGCVFYGHTEGWGVIKTIYFLTTTITTVGYGDVSPVHELSRFVSVFFILFGLAVIFTIIAGVANRIIAAAEAKALAAADDDPTDEKEPHVTKIMISIGMIIFCIMLGAVFYQLNGEFNGRFVKSMWWSLATVTTIGYGDLSLEKDSSRVFTIFFMLFSVIISAAAIGNISAVRDDIVREKKATAALERLDFTMLKHMDKDGDGIDVNECVPCARWSPGRATRERDALTRGVSLLQVHDRHAANARACRSRKDRHAEEAVRGSRRGQERAARFGRPERARAPARA